MLDKRWGIRLFYTSSSGTPTSEALLAPDVKGTHLNAEIELAWAAGLFEGEGTITASTRPDGFVRYINLALTMTDEDVVRRFARAVGLLRIKTYPGVTEGRKFRHVWQTNRITEVLRIYMLLEPHLGERRKARAVELFNAYASCRRERSA